MRKRSHANHARDFKRREFVLHPDAHGTVKNAQHAQRSSTKSSAQSRPLVTLREWEVKQNVLHVQTLRRRKNARVEDVFG
mmetsp:Transcript_9564/g.11199  ORF Transcript_9564/g.11199 Transcript_9564/m.11199 type:complete len:80 (+) Transcript_9564:339-578(+)